MGLGRLALVHGDSAVRFTDDSIIERRNRCDLRQLINANTFDNSLGCMTKASKRMLLRRKLVLVPVTGQCNDSVL